MSEAYLVGGVRTPVGRYGGALASVRPDDLAALVVAAAVHRAGVDPGLIDDVVLGCANQAGEDNRDVARMAALLADLPESVPGLTVNRLCASGLQAVATAAQQVRCGQSEVVVAGGVESMTRAPWVTAKPSTSWARPGETADSALGWRFVNPRMAALDGNEATLSLGLATEKLARLDGVTRQESDAFALLSQTRAAAAWEAGWFDAEVLPVTSPDGRVVSRDETVRPTTADGLARLSPSFDPDGVVTAGSASPLSDGASALVVASGEAVERLGLVPRARVVGYSVVGVPPSLFGIGPVGALERLEERHGVSRHDLDVVEINEAFAAQVVACERRLGLDRERLNPVGGAIALGHPLGSSGSRMVVTTLGQLERTGGTTAMVTLCVGVGQGAAMLLERV